MDLDDVFFPQKMGWVIDEKGKRFEKFNPSTLLDK